MKKQTILVASGFLACCVTLVMGFAVFILARNEYYQFSELLTVHGKTSECIALFTNEKPYVGVILNRTYPKFVVIPVRKYPRHGFFMPGDDAVIEYRIGEFAGHPIKIERLIIAGDEIEL